MFRRWFSKTMKNNQWKIGTVLKIVAFAVIAIYIILSIFIGFKDEGINSNNINMVYKPAKTVISGKDIKEEEFEENNNIINTFISYCNDGKAKEAYDLLTDECKENIYPNVSNFEKKYINKYFSEKKEYNLQSWVNKKDYNTYKMRIIEDILSSGDYENAESFEDYITIVNKEGEDKININGYIGRVDINKITEEDGIKVEVIKLEEYMNYEEYTLKVTNNTENTILLDNMQDSMQTLRIISNNGNTYPVIPSSINYITMSIESGKTEELKIQFNKKYTSNENSKEICFSKVVKDYKQYMKAQTNYTDMIKLNVKV